MILKVFASVLTGIGGHYLNRRWDKAILFLCLFVFYWIAGYAVFLFFLQNISSSTNDMIQEINNATLLFSKATAIGTFVLWLASLIITILDCRKKVDPNFTKWTKSGITGAILSSILSFILLAVTAATVFSLSDTQTVVTDATVSESEFSSFSSHNFYEYLYFN